MHRRIRSGGVPLAALGVALLAGSAQPIGEVQEPVKIAVSSTPTRSTDPRPEAPDPRAVVPAAAPFSVPPGNRYVFNPRVDRSPGWSAALAAARENKAAGTLMRVFLEDAGPGETIQVAGGWFSDPGRRGGGGSTLDLPSGSFVFVHFLPGVARRGRASMDVASPVHGVSRVRIPMGDGSRVGAGGDIVLGRVRPDEMGELVIELSDEVGPQPVSIGTLMVGGGFPGAFACEPGAPCTIGPVAPGPYKLAFPERGRAGRPFEVSVSPATRSVLVFGSDDADGIALVSQSQSPMPGGAPLPAAVLP